VSERCAAGWKLSEAAREALAAGNGHKTSAYQQALEELRAHFATCPDCRAWFLAVPADGKAAANINPDL
jgi:predicted anti-sigma-YlaC factor YlaD